TAHSNFQSILTSHPNLVRGTFILPIGLLGDKLKLTINDTILFTRIIKYLIATFDSALCVADQCENILEDRLRDLTSIHNKWQSLPHDQTKREQRIHRMLSASKI